MTAVGTPINSVMPVRDSLARRMVVPILTLLIALSAGYGVLTLRNHADSQRQGEILLVRLESLSARQGTLQWQAVGEQQLSAELESQVRDLRGRLSVLLVELSRVTPRNETIASVQSAVVGYERTVDDILRLLATGRLSEAQEQVRTHAQPAYVMLSGLLDEESARYRAMASRTSERADLGAIMALVSAAVLVLLLYLRFERMRHHAVLQLGEERGLRQGEARFRSLVQHSSDTITVIDGEGRILYQSPSAARLLGHDPATLVGHPLLELCHPDDAELVTQTLEQLRRTADPLAVEWRIRHQDGSWMHVESLLTDLSDDATVAGYVLNTRDISERKALEDRLAHRAFYDGLTDLPNRVLFRERLEQALVQNRQTGTRTAVLFLDLDGFKAVNDTLGHAAGDKLLVVMADRLRSAIRPGDTVARLAGDEFAVLLPSVMTADEAAAVARRTIELMSDAVRVGGREFWLTASVGVALSGASAPTGEELIRNADLAMYAAKAAGKACFKIFDPQMHLKVMERVELEGALRKALEEHELTLAYQPIVSLIDGSILAAEALLRWESTEYGPVKPAVVIAVAEASGLIVPLGRHVLNEACAEAVTWPAIAAGEPPAVTVNVSQRELEEPGFVDHLRAVLDRTGLPGERLYLEVTEGVLARNEDRLPVILSEVRTLGVRVALDDFGSGYSSLSLLHRLPLDMLKLDRAFLGSDATRELRPQLVKSMVTIGRSNRILTVAEGIETYAHVAQLRELGCELGQGYLIQPPIPAPVLRSLLADGRLRVDGPAPTRVEAPVGQRPG